MAEVPTPEPVDGFVNPDQVPIEIWRIPKPGRPPVLLLHGASAQHETFCIPRGRSLSEFLWDQGDYDVWLLDWRGSRKVTDAMGPEKLQQWRDVLDLDHAASEDIPLALQHIADVIDADDDSPKYKIHVVAHCLGAAVLAQAIAGGDAPILRRIGRVVLLTIGLFYEPPLDGKAKSQFNVLDRLWKAGSVSLIDPRTPERTDTWPPELRSVYDGIGPGLRPHPQADVEALGSHALCNRVSFMYGTPFRHSHLDPKIHGVRHVPFTKGAVEPRKGERIRSKRSPEASKHEGVGFVSCLQLAAGSWSQGDARGTIGLSGACGAFPSEHPLATDDDEIIGVCGGSAADDTPPELGRQFGGIPIRMYFQGAQNVRRRWAAPFDEAADGSASLQKQKSYIDEQARRRFESLPAVTLITGAHNQLWHRDSINRMYEWLTGGRGSGLRAKFQKEILLDYGHQDLLWGKSASSDVFPIIVDRGLGGKAAPILADPDGPSHGPDWTSSH